MHPAYLTAIACFVVGMVGFTVGTYSDRTEPTKFTKDQTADLVWECRTHEGAAEAFKGGVLCRPGGGKPTPEEGMAEAKRQERLLDKRRTEVLLEEIERRRLAR